jgi:antitoxin component YwqK of YwqJK toxin-antitoxin module
VNGRETYADGKVKAAWSGRIAPSGRFVLDGAETWFYPDGKKQYEVTWRSGAKAGAETYWREDGGKAWEWEHRADGTKIWTQYWRGGKMKSRSGWRGGKADGEAVRWDYTGKEIARHEFRDGELLR